MTDDPNATITVADLIAELQQHDGKLSVALEVGDMLYTLDAVAVYGSGCLTFIAGVGVPLGDEPEPKRALA